MISCVDPGWYYPLLAQAALSAALGNVDLMLEMLAAAE